ncbi:MAG: hypothetical protein SPJ92_01705 [Bariatricus sp.]|nr:hypothetical protein [Bariatricus sp.]
MRQEEMEKEQEVISIEEYLNRRRKIRREEERRQEGKTKEKTLPGLWQSLCMY